MELVGSAEALRADLERGARQLGEAGVLDLGRLDLEPQVPQGPRGIVDRRVVAGGPGESGSIVIVGDCLERREMLGDRARFGREGVEGAGVDAVGAGARRAGDLERRPPSSARRQ